MKITLYTTLAVSALLWWTSSAKSKTVRADICFKYIGPTSPSTPSTAITTLSNWTITSCDVDFCSFNQIACAIQTDNLNLQIITIGVVTRHIPRKVYRSGKAAVTGGTTAGQVVLAAYNDLYH